MTLFQFYKQFDTEKKCINYLMKIRWPNGVICPHCGNDRHYVIGSDTKNCNGSWKKEKTPTRFKCANNKCYKKFSAKSGTIFHSSNVPLWQFFYFIFSTALNKKNISSVQQGLNLGIMQKTAWYIMMRIRMLCYQDWSLKLDGEVEVDESYVAHGKWRKRYTKYVSGRKIPVLGILQRNGKVIIKVIPNRYRKTVQNVILNHVEVGSDLFTDCAACYLNIDSYYVHQTVNHRAGEYVRGNVHTNGIESFWSHFKKAINGTHHSTSMCHLQRYCDELAYRWNTKWMTPMQRFNDILLRGCSTKPIPWHKVMLSAKDKSKIKIDMGGNIFPMVFNGKGDVIIDEFY